MVFDCFLPQLLMTPNAEHPLNKEAAALLMSDKANYEATVKDVEPSASPSSGNEAMAVVLCENVVESVDHALALCEKALGVWDRLFAWWGIGPVNAFTIKDLLRHNGGPTMKKDTRLLWQATVLVSAYLTWKNRNKVFRGKMDSSSRVFQDIQFKAFEWINRRSKKCNFRWEKWLERPQSCASSPSHNG
nr:squalene synthase [Tanacetum cinerariifolium]